MVKPGHLSAIIRYGLFELNPFLELNCVKLIPSYLKIPPPIEPIQMFPFTSSVIVPALRLRSPLSLFNVLKSSPFQTEIPASLDPKYTGPFLEAKAVQNLLLHNPSDLKKASIL